MLVNFWWGSNSHQYGSPFVAMLHAMMSVKNLPEAHRAVWRGMFDYYVFEVNGPTGDHLPADLRGVMGKMTSEQIAALSAKIAGALGHGARSPSLRPASFLMRSRRLIGAALRRAGLR